MKGPLVSDEDFQILEPVGTGSFSTVYHATDSNGREFALKRLFWNNSPERVMKEVRWCRGLDHPNIVKIRAVYRTNDQATLVMDYIPHIPFRTFLTEMDGTMTASYLHGLLSALAYIHQKKIIHRDIKPANYLFNPETCHGCLIDFGLCENDAFVETELRIPDNSVTFDLDYPQFVTDKPKMWGSRAGTRGFRAPEVLLAVANQSCKIDIWSVGVILLSILTQRYPFFKSPDDLTSLVEISVILGTDRLRQSALKLGRKLRFPCEQKGYNMADLVRSLNPTVDTKFSDCIFDLLVRMLDPDPSTRLSAEEALQHPFFNGVTKS